MRTDRIGSTLRAIVADELSRIGDDSVAHVAVTEVEVDRELSRARIYLSSLDLDDGDIAGVVAHGPRIKAAIARRASIRRVPELEFHIDPALVAGNRVEAILADLADDRAFADSDAGAGADGGGDSDTSGGPGATGSSLS